MLINRKNIHGGAPLPDPETLDFSANINPFGTPLPVADAMVASVKNAALYPDPYCRELRYKTAGRKGLPEDALLFGNGAAEIIYQFAFCLPRDRKALICMPTFCEYGFALDAAGIAYDTIRFSDETDFRPEEKKILACLQGYSAIFICSPNNPTGAVFPLEWLKKIAESGIKVFLDLSFIDFADDPDMYRVPELIHRFPNIVFLFSFTKCFAMPGVRLGYAACGDAVWLEKMAEKAQCWNVSAIAQAAGAAALDCETWLRESVRKIRRERERLTERMRSLGLTVYPSEANFLLVRGEKPLVGALASKGIRVRDCASFPGLSDRYFRTAIRTKDENDRLLQALEEVIR